MFKIKKAFTLVVLIGIMSLILTVCSPNAPTRRSETVDPQATSHDGGTGGYVDLVESLRAEDADVNPAGEVEQPFFEVEGQIIQVNG